MATTLLLIRHCEHDRPGPLLVGRDDGVDLSPAGERAARRMADHLAARALAAVVTSPSRRCRTTAAILAAPHGLRPEPEPDLDELDFGAWRGRRFAELEGDPAWVRFNTARGTARIPGGEAVADVAARVARALGRIAERAPDRTVAMVSHGDVIRTALCGLLGLAPDLMLRFEVDPGSVSTAVVGGPAPRVLAINWRLDGP